MTRYYDEIMDRHEDNELLSRFVAAFEKLDDLWTCPEMDPIAWTLSVGELSDDKLKRWRPVRCQVDRSAIDDFYKACPHRLPPLYEDLVLGTDGHEWTLEVSDCSLIRPAPNSREC